MCCRWPSAYGTCYVPPSDNACFASLVVSRQRRFLCHPVDAHPATGAASLTMRKQKASDRRTRRMQRGEDTVVDAQPIQSAMQLISSPMESAGWQHKKLHSKSPQRHTAGRGRSRKRSNLYNSLSSYHGHFLSLLTSEYRAEVSVIAILFEEKDTKDSA